MSTALTKLVAGASVVAATGIVALAALGAVAYSRWRSPHGSTRELDRADVLAHVGREPTEHRVPVRDGALHVVEWRPADSRTAESGPAGGGRVFLLVHGYTSSFGDWAAVVPGLLAAGHRVVAMDLAGHGQSSGASSGAVDVSRVADDVRAVIEQLALDDLVVVGHSLGGLAVLALAGGDPGFARTSLRHVVSVAGPPVLRRAPELSALVFGMNPVGSILLRRPRIGRLLMRLGLFGRHADPEIVENVRRRLSVCSLATRQAYALGMMGTDIRELLTAIPVPVTAVVGRVDRLVPPARGRMIADLVTDGRVRVLRGAGHVIMWERSDALAEILLESAADVT